MEQVVEKQLTKEEALKNLKKYFGSAKPYPISDEEAGERAFDRIAKKLRISKKENTEKLIKEITKYKGKAKKKTTYEENRKTREIVGEEFFKELEKKFK